MWKLVGTALIATIISVAISTAVTYKIMAGAMRPSAYPEVIRAQRIELFDDYGVPRAFLGFGVDARHPDMPLLRLDGPNRTSAIELTVNQKDQSQLVFSDDLLDGRMILGYHGLGDVYPVEPDARVWGLTIHGTDGREMGFSMSDAGDYYVSPSRRAPSHHATR